MQTIITQKKETELVLLSSLSFHEIHTIKHLEYFTKARTCNEYSDFMTV